jgi:hypothetical protein
MWLIDSLGKGNKSVAILFVGIFFFMCAMFTAALIVSFWQLKIGRYMAKHHSELWEKHKISMFSSSIKYKYEVYKQMTSLSDPIVDKLSGKGEKYWKYGFLLWFIVFLLVAVIILTFSAEGT